jgi:hypothetical protein
MPAWRSAAWTRLNAMYRWTNCPPAECPATTTARSAGNRSRSTAAESIASITVYELGPRSGCTAGSPIFQPSGVQYGVFSPSANFSASGVARNCGVAMRVRSVPAPATAAAASVLSK